MLKLAHPVHLEATDTPSVDLATVMAALQDRVAVLEQMERSDHPLVVGALPELLTDALIYLKRYEDLRRDLTPRDHGEA